MLAFISLRPEATAPEEDVYKRQVYLLGKVPSPKILLKAFEEVKPNLILTVPLILEKIYKKMILHLQDRGMIGKKSEGRGSIYGK